MKIDILNRYFGIELEVGNEIKQELIFDLIKSKTNKLIVKTEKWAQSLNNDFWHIKYDSTCGVKGKPEDHGWEIASFKAKGIADLSHICEVAEFLKNSGCLINNNCGLHIHADVSEFSTSKMGSFLNRWLKIESFLLNMMPTHRKDNYHCKPLNTKLCLKNLKKSKPENTWSLLRPKVFKIHNNAQKRFSLNLINYAKYIRYNNSKNNRPTIEFRLPEGTLNYEDVFNWTYFYLNLIYFSFNRSYIDNVIPVKNIESFFSVSGISSSKNEDLKNWFIKRLEIYSK